MATLHKSGPSVFNWAVKPYEQTRRQYRPQQVHWLLIAESPPPDNFAGGSRHFYRADQARPEDRLFSNTMRALYADATEAPEEELQRDKATWLQRFQADGWYLIEACEESIPHKVPKKERQERIQEALPSLIRRVRKLAGPETKLILIKSNVYEVACQPLREAGFTVLNEGLVDYPGRCNQRAYREKLARLAQAS